MATKTEGGITVTYDSQAMTNYCNSHDLQMTVDKLESTNFGSDGKEYEAGLGDFSIGMGGDWDPVVDGKFGPDSVTPTTGRTAVITISDGTTTVTYTWTTKAGVENYNVSGATGSLIGWTADLILSGAPTRGTS